MEHLVISQNDYDTEQMLRLAKRYADEGNENAKVAIRSSLRYSSQWNCYVGAEELIGIDLLEGLYQVTEIIGEKVMTENYDEIDRIYIYAKDLLGEDTVNAFFDQNRHNLNIAAYLKSVHKYQNNILKNATQYEQIPYDEIRDSIQKTSTNKQWTHYMVWGKRATDLDVEKAAHDLLTQNDPHKLFLYCCIFQNRKYPLNVEPILSLARSRNKKVSNKAILMLRNLNSESIREFSLELLQKRKPNSYALELLVHHYRGQDIGFIENIIFRKQSKDSFHYNALDVLKIASNNTIDSLWMRILLHIYREGCCANCREMCVDILIKNQLLPEDIRRDCMFDCNLEIRMKVR